MTTGAKPDMGFAPVFCFMTKYLFDILGLIGLILLAAGIYLAFGLAWALMTAGLLLLLLALLGARGRQ